MKKITIIFIFTLLCSQGFSQWQSVGGDVSSGFSRYQSLAFHPFTNEPYMAFMDGSNSAVSVKKFNGSSWVYVGPPLFTGSFSPHIDLAFDPVSGEPYMAFSDNGNSNKTSVMKFDGTNWVNVGLAGFSATGTGYNNIKFNPLNNQLYVAFIGANSQCTVMTFNGSSWVNVGAAAFSPGQIVGHIGLDFHPLTGDPYVLFTDMDNGQVATCMMFNGSSWGNVGPIGFSPGLASNVSLVFNPLTNEPYAAFSDVFNNGASVMKYDGSNWVYVGNSAFSPGVASDNHIGFQPITNDLFIVFRDWANGNGTAVMKFDGTSWGAVGSPLVDVGSNDYRNLAFHPITYEVYVAYQANNAANNVGRVRKFPECIIDISVIQNSDTLIANQTGATYQWLDCNNGNTLIAGATSQSYVAAANGSYAVSITLGSCVDTSACINMLVTSVMVEEQTIEVNIYPNPNNGGFSVALNNTENKQVQIEVLNALGQRVYLRKVNSNVITIDLQQPKGIYFLKVASEKGVRIRQVIVK